MNLIVKRIVSAICFWTISIGLVVGAGQFLRAADEDDRIWASYYAQEKDSIGTVVIGSSAIYRYWIPTQGYKEQNFTSYMLTFGSQPIETTPYIMEEAVKTQTPDLFVVEVRKLVADRATEYKEMADVQEDMYALRRVVSGMKYSRIRKSMMDEFLIEGEEEKYLEWSIPLLNYHEDIFRLKPSKYVSTIKKMLNPENQPWKGNRQVAYVEPLSTKIPKSWDKNAYILTEQDKQKLDDIVNKAKELNIELLFVSTPYKMDHFTYALQHQMNQYMKEKGYPYLNMTGEKKEEMIGLNRATDFYNARHTNIAGAKKVTTYMASYIAKHYQVHGPMNQKQKESWELAVSDWEIEEKNKIMKWEMNCNKLKE